MQPSTMTAADVAQPHIKLAMEKGEMRDSIRDSSLRFSHRCFCVSFVLVYFIVDFGSFYVWGDWLELLGCS